MYAQAIEEILKDHCTPAAVRSIEAGASPDALDGVITEAGFLELLAGEERGGADAGWREFHAVVVLCGAYAVPLPLPQTIAARALAEADEGAMPGRIAFAGPLGQAADGTLEARLVPFGRTASHVVGEAGDAIVLLPVAAARASASGVHGSLTTSFRWPPGAGRVLRHRLRPGQFQAIAALLQAGLLVGAMKRVFDLTMTYANDRVQFGKPIGKFQAIQHQLSVMAEHVAAASIATEAAFATEGELPAVRECAVAKSRTSEAAQLVASIGHAVHGAIGVTEEYDLQLFTRRLHEGRLAHGSEDHWNGILGSFFLQSSVGAVDFVRTLQRVS